MSETRAVIHVSPRAPLAERLAGFAPPWDLRPWAGGRTAGLAVLTPAEARPLLAAGEPGPILLWLDTPGETTRELLAQAGVVGALDAESSAAAVYATLNAVISRQSAGSRAAQRLERVLDIGRALASEKDLDTLLGLILMHARHLTCADGASIYTLDSTGALYFRLWQNVSAGNASEIQKTPVGEKSIATYVAHTGEILMLADAYVIPPEAPYHFNPYFDQSTGYRTRSMLTVPLTNKANEVVGVLQLINRKDAHDTILKDLEDFERHVMPFDEHDRDLAAALAGQAGVALENSMLYADIERLFEGFIRASVQAIEARDPTTAGHSGRVADYTERFAIAVDRSGEAHFRDVRFSKDELRELRYASLLHDFGKVGVREHVLVKAKKLLPHQLELVKGRFRYARASLERYALRELLALHDRQLTAAEFGEARRRIEERLAAERARLEQQLEAVLRANEPSVLAQDVSAGLAEIAATLFPGEEDEQLPLLHDFEFADLSLPKGSLNAQEREEIESHVSHTYAFLSLIPWTKNLANLPHIAYAHHEKLDGSGYPRRLQPADIPLQSRMMTISDIYDALTAADRPYKRAMPSDRALDILAAEAKSGKVDGRLFEVFVASNAWQLTG